MPLWPFRSSLQPRVCAALASLAWLGGRGADVRRHLKELKQIGTEDAKSYAAQIEKAKEIFLAYGNPYLPLCRDPEQYDPVGIGPAPGATVWLEPLSGPPLFPTRWSPPLITGSPRNHRTQINCGDVVGL